MNKKLSNVNSKKYLINTLYFTIGIFFICVLGIILTKDIKLWVDIGIGDEAKYLSDGVNLLTNKPDPAWAPLYSIWYFFLSLFQNDPINLYYLNYKLMTILPSITLYLYLLKMKVSPTLSFYFSFALLISLINLPTWPKVSHFGLSLIFIGFIIAHGIKDKNARVLSAFIISLILFYIRPEFMLSSLLFAGIIIKRVIKNDFGIKRISIAVLTTIILFFLFGIPYSPARNITAFGQAYHKYLDISERIDDDGAKDWTEILSEHFGDPKSITDAAFNDSDKFIKHIRINFYRLPTIYINFIETLFPNNIFPISFIIKIIIVLSITSLLFVLLLLNKIGRYREVIFNGFTEKKDLLIFSIIFSLPPLLSIILYYPRSHYILLLLPLIYLFVSQMIIPLKFNSFIKNFISFCFLILIAFLFIPQLSSYYIKSNFKNLTAVHSIKNLNISERINLMENEGGLSVYLPDNYKWIRLESKKGNFDEFLNENNINMIYYSNLLNNSVQLKKDSTWFRFLKYPETFGFNKLKIKDGGRIYIKNEIKVK